MRWSEAVTLEFVKIYLKHECLWNPAHPRYSLRRERDIAYSDISSEFKDSTSKNLSVPEVKVKIKNLRTTYAQQLHKILQRSSPDAIYEPSLIWFQEMDRCLKNISNVRTSNTSHQAPEVDSSCQIWVDQEDQDNTEEPNPDPLVSQTDEEYEPEQSQNTGIKRERSSPKPYKKIKKKKFKHRTHLPDSNSECVAREDEFDIYGKFIASQLRQMDLQKALRLQLEIQSLVSDARISDLS